MESLLRGEDIVASDGLWQRVPGTLGPRGSGSVGRLMLCPLHVRTLCRVPPPGMHRLCSLDTGFWLWSRPRASPQPRRPHLCLPGREQPVPSQALGHNNSHTLVRALVLLQALPYELSMIIPRFQTRTLRHEEVKVTCPRPCCQQVVESRFESKPPDSSPFSSGPATCQDCTKIRNPPSQDGETQEMAVTVMGPGKLGGPGGVPSRLWASDSPPPEGGWH